MEIYSTSRCVAMGIMSEVPTAYAIDMLRIRYDLSSDTLHNIRRLVHSAQSQSSEEPVGNADLFLDGRNRQ
jgi:hypothetical protein